MNYVFALLIVSSCALVVASILLLILGLHIFSLIKDSWVIPKTSNKLKFAHLFYSNVVAKHTALGVRDSFLVSLLTNKFDLSVTSDLTDTQFLYNSEHGIDFNEVIIFLMGEGYDVYIESID